MHPRDLASKYDVKVFDSLDAAQSAGFAFTQTMSPRNVWNRDSAASAILYDLLARKQRGEATEIALALETATVAGCVKKEGRVSPDRVIEILNHLSAISRDPEGKQAYGFCVNQLCIK